MFLKCSKLVWLVMIAPSLATAQDTTPPHFKASVVVTPERAETERKTVPAAGDVLGEQEIRLLPAISAAELLAELPSFRTTFPAASGLPPIVSSRGFFGGGEAEYVQLRVDGVPVGDIETGLADWRAFSAAEIERVETLRGPASSLYGDTALGGVVQLFTVRRTEAGGRMSLSVGGWDTADLEGSGGVRAGGIVVNGSAGYLRSDGFRAHTGIRQSRGRFSADASAGGLWRGQVMAWSRDREEPGPVRANSVPADRRTSSELFSRDGGAEHKAYASLTYRRTMNGWSLQATGHGSRRRADSTRTLLILPDVGLPAHRLTDASHIGAILDVGRRIGPLEWRAGADLSREHLDTVYPESGVVVDGALSPEALGARRRGALFSTAAWSPTARLRITSGVRYDIVSDAFAPPEARKDQRAWSPRLGATMLIGSLETPLTVFAQMSRAFKSATLDQLFDPRPFPDFQGGFLTLSNQLLRPQRATNIEFGAYRRTADLDWQATYYHTRVKDEIDFDVATFSYQNIGRSSHTGVELDANWRLATWIAPRAAFTWTRVRNPLGLGQLKKIPEFTWRVGTRSELPAGLYLDARLSGTSAAFLDDENRFPLANASRVDLRASRTFGRLRMRLDALNLFDRRSDAFGFALTDLDGARVPFVYPGAGRLVRAGFDIDF